ncbi:hypothetical protein [Pseudomonas phage PA1C]|uniref:Uncharacterized protein n=1 Tax=Pseudomonas phage vB_PaeM_PS119XW TaxID=2601632 RepID=A0A5C1K7C0_9CAUD|nr:hypothetical protein PP933_gp066 [Pseudomonas phage vB_PaeM_PS119XW]QBX32217.1 hypothetical protein [Pseudomonas phage PA1C]QEM41795.1 hypothetical protein [Pseudomonas phage vB_PaeM_PS119XW]BEG72705.1 hypothetical protein RVBP21_3330 [Pseudomonas phage BRkr]
MHGINMGISAGAAVNSKLSVQNFVLVETGTYQEQHIRPFSINANQEVARQLEQATNGGMNLRVSAVQEVASSVITPQASVEGSVGIAHGWRSRRFRFLMKVNEQHPFIAGTLTQRIFFGYSDHADASQNYLPDDMRIYFNSETIIAQAIQQTIHGPQHVASIVGSNQIVSPVDMMGGMNGMFSRATAHLIRPEDIFSIGQTAHVAQKLQSSGLFDGMINRSIDHRTMVGEGGAYKYSQRRDTSPTRYLSNTLGAYQHAVKENAMENQGDDLFGAPDKDVMFGEAAAQCRNQQIHTNTFLAVLKDHAGYMENGYITFRDLKRLFPECGTQQVTQFSMNDGRSIRRISQAEDSEVWSGADYTSIGASLLAQTIPSIMMDTFLRTCSFAVTNGTGPNNYSFEFHPQNSKAIIDNLDMRQYILEFERRLAIDILNNITRGNQLPFRISMHSDLAGDSIIDIAIGGQSLTRFIAPTFTDSLFSPMITRNEQHPTNLSGDMLWLVQEVIPNPTQHQALQSVGYQHPVAAPIMMPNAINQGASNVVDLGLV